jgi:hypothetical protein
MKPEILTLDVVGEHNANLTKSASRIFEGGSWKRQRVIMLLPSATKIAAKVALSHMSLIYPPNQGVYRMLCLGMEVGEAYSTAIEQILGHPELSQWEYLLTVEHDNMPPPDGLLKLLKRMEENQHFSCIGGLYWTKGEGGVPQIWGDVRDPQVNFRPQVPSLNGDLVECYGTGMGFNVWRLAMFKDGRLRRPWFKTLTGIEGHGVGTQDLYFWGDARKYGYRCAIDCGVLVGHYDEQNDLVW